jgi:hypothetical protein
VEDNDAYCPSEIDKFAKIKVFLQFYGPLTIESYVHLPESLTNPVPSNSPDQLKLNLVSKIRRSLEVIDFCSSFLLVTCDLFREDLSFLCISNSLYRL